MTRKSVNFFYIVQAQKLKTYSLRLTLPEPADYAATKTALTDYFKPARNVPYQRHLFRQAKQQESETVTQYVTRLRQLARDCDFGNGTDDFIRDQVIDKCSSTPLRTKLLAEKKLNSGKMY